MITVSPLDSLERIAHGFFPRTGGVSLGLYDSRNCGFGSGDKPANVAENRTLCMAELANGGPRPGLVTVHQIHSPTVAVVEAPWLPADAPKADALVTDRPGVALGVLSADCIPVLFADTQAGVIGAAHAGWRGALDGVLEATVTAMTGLGAAPGHIVAAIGPCIAQASYEVGPEFRERFAAAEPGAADLFRPSARDDHHLFDLPGFAVRRLERLGLNEVAGAARDTAAEPDHFFSYRRSCLQGEPDYGRGLSAIVLTR